MKGKDYLETRKKQDELLALINDSTPDDDSKIKELLSLQEDCDGFERENVHKGYAELKLNLEIKTVVGVIRSAHEAGMNVSDFVRMLLNDYVDAADEFTWTTNLVSPADYNWSGYPVIIPEGAMNKGGWRVGDFVKVTLTDETLSVKNLHIE